MKGKSTQVLVMITFERFFSVFFFDHVYNDIKSEIKVNEQPEREQDNLAVSDLFDSM